MCRDRPNSTLAVRGKSAISAYVGVCHGLLLWGVGLGPLSLPFGVLTFFLNFIPNVGGMVAVCLPMPLVALGVNFSGAQGCVAFLVPLANNIFAKDVLEPKILGDATNLSPVVVLLSILVFGSVWGVVGMVLAIPLTAVVRIYLESLDHPVTKLFARRLVGSSAVSPSAASDDRTSLHGHREDAGEAVQAALQRPLLSHTDHGVPPATSFTPRRARALRTP